MSLLKALYENVKTGLRPTFYAAISVFLCLLFIYSYEQFDHLRMKIDLVETRVETVRETQVVQERVIRETEESNSLHSLRLDQIDHLELRQGHRLSLMDHDQSHLMRYVQAAHACFLVNEFAQSAEDNCTETGDRYYCGVWRTFEENCMRVDEEGNWVLPPDPGVYNQLMALANGQQGQ